MTKYILVTGGVISGIGKGIIASSTGFLLKTLGLHVTSIKIDPYLNIDAGTISPIDHGEVFVLDDGGEVDQDLGNYERFLDVSLTFDHNITTGKIYQQVIERERRGDYLGKTVQVVPHITNAVQDWIERVAQIPVDDSQQKPDVCVIELGGTVGDIESAPFIEALRQFQFRVGHENFAVIHVSLVPVVGSVGEQKTKPTQASVRDLRGLGLSPDIIACRSTKILDVGIKEKISMFCHVAPDNVLAIHDCNSIYHVPLLMERQGLLSTLKKRLNLVENKTEQSINFFNSWKTLAHDYDELLEKVNIVLVGKYTHLSDSYISVIKALEHASLYSKKKLVLTMIESSNLDSETKVKNPTLFETSWATVKNADGLIVPGGFGDRGIEGIIEACRFARESKTPFFGICLALQLTAIEAARSKLGFDDAHSTEFNAETKHPIVVFMPEVSKTHLGGTMRLGSRVSKFVKKDSKAQSLYGGAAIIHERHRHRYEVNPEYVAQLESTGLIFASHDEDQSRMEIVEYPDHPYYVAVQFHPEFKSRPLKPAPLFVGLIQAASQHNRH